MIINYVKGRWENMAKNFVCGRCAAVVKGAPPYMTRDGFPICSECLEKYRIRTVKTLDEIILMREVPKVMNAIPGLNKPINKPVTKPVTKPVEPVKKPVKGAVEVDDDPFKEDFKVSGPLDFANATFENEDEINEQIEQARAYDEVKPAMSFGAKAEEEEEESVEAKPKKEEKIEPVHIESKKEEIVKPVHVEPKKEEKVEPVHIEPKKEETKASTDSSVDYLKLAEDLERFSQLAKAGILSDEEFKAIKAKIISKML